MIREKRVLIVEDEPLIAMDIQSHFLENGWVVVGPVGSIEQALKLIDTDMPSLGILDINLHNQNSYTVAEKLQQRQIPVIFLSGEDGADRPKHLAAMTVVSKPVDYFKLQAAAEAHLAG